MSETGLNTVLLVVRLRAVLIMVMMVAAVTVLVPLYDFQTQSDGPGSAAYNVQFADVGL